MARISQIVLLDSSALNAALLLEPRGVPVLRLLESGAAVGISAINLAETVYLIGRSTKSSPEEIQASLIEILTSRVSVVPVTQAEAIDGANLRLKYYQRSRSPLSYADCTLLATAKLYEATLMTSDRAVIETARAEMIPVLHLAA